MRVKTSCLELQYALDLVSRLLTHKESIPGVCVWLRWAVSGVETGYELSEAGEYPLLLLPLFWIEQPADGHVTGLLSPECSGGGWQDWLGLCVIVLLGRSMAPCH